MQTVSGVWQGEQSLETLKSQVPASAFSLLIQVFWGSPSLDSLPALQSQLQKLFPSAAVMGVQSAGSIVEGKAVEEVVVSISAFEKVRLKPLFLTGLSALNAGQEVAKTLTEQEPALILSFINGRLNGEAFVDGFSGTTPMIPLAGAMAGDALAFQDMCVFDANQVSNQGIVACGFYGDLQVRQDALFDWQPIGPKFTVTKAKNNVVHEIDNRPVLAFYRDYLGEEVVDRHMPKIAMSFPLIFHKGEHAIARACLEVLEEGALRYAGELETGQTVQFGIGTPHELLKNAANHLNDLQGEPAESVFIYESAGRKLLLEASIEGELALFNRLAPASGFFGYAELSRLEEQNVLLNQTLSYVALSEGEATQSSAQPLKGDAMQSTLADEDYKAVMLQSMAHLTTKLAEGLEQLRRQYQQMAEHDQLTGLYNRYAGERILQAEMERATRTESPFSLAILDIDLFKQVNDTYGHDAGDEVLKAWADYLRQHVRRYDSVVRWGGEEVLVIFPNTTAETAKQVLDKLREGFAEKTFSFGEHITFSGGVAEWKPYLSELELFKRADKALYQAKTYGRNQIVMAPDNPLF
jgi:diguanylate cyclase (GGDEF)-like protein